MMKRSIYKYLFPVLIVMVYIACKKAYNPTAVNGNLNYLVVEGLINSGGVDSTIIKLSRTTNISSGVNFKAEIASSVKIEGDDNTTYVLTEKGGGIYYRIPQSLNIATKYRIHIITSDHKEYLSDYTEIKIPPPIDSIDFNVLPDGLQLEVNTHNAQNNTRYYRWEYTETWEYYSAFQSLVVSNGNAVVTRDMINNQIYHCWNTGISTTIILGSTVKLGQDVVSHLPLTKIESTSEKIFVKYSMLVKQYALNSAGFDYWQNIKKNNESLGSIFDSQPSDIQGNIHCVSNSTEIVIGFISAGTVQSKRIFINKDQLPSAWRIPQSSCRADSLYFDNPKTHQNDDDKFYNGFNPILIPIEEITDGNGKLLGHTGASKICVDCRLRGGVNKKPAFWP